ncbi:hypothetical protein RFI_02875, partial [Reticulomyxa filosa]
MSSTSAFFQTLQHPTAVDRCVTASFTGPKDTNLVLAKNNVLEIYKLFTKQKADIGEAIFTIWDNKISMVSYYYYFFFFELSLFGKKKKKNVEKKTAFLDSKLSILDYEEGVGDVVTSGVYNFDELCGLRLGNKTCNPRLCIRSDPLSRCVAYQATNDVLFILPCDQQHIKNHNEKQGAKSIGNNL